LGWSLNRDQTSETRPSSAAKKQFLFHKVGHSRFRIGRKEKEGEGEKEKGKEKERKKETRTAFLQKLQQWEKKKRIPCQSAVCVWDL